MKLARQEGDRFVFEMGRRERVLWQEVLRHFPLIPTSHHKLTRVPDANVDATDQELLEEAMAARKREQKGRLGKLLDDKQRWGPRGNGYRITFTREEMEWLLQVLNDVRVGSWLALGGPDPMDAPVAQMDEATARHIFLMEVSGHFECVLLEALGG
jgi:hypothetical protein